MVITPTLETLRFIGSRSDEIRKWVDGVRQFPSNQEQSLAANMVAHIYTQQLGELVIVLHQAGQTLLASEVALSIPLPSIRCAALQYLGRLGPGNLPFLGEAFDTVKKITSEREQTLALVQLASDLPLELLPEAVVLARQITWGYGKVCSLHALAQRCVDLDVQYALLEEAFAVALQIDEPQDAADAILVLLPEMNWQRADGAIQALLRLVRRLPTDGRRINLLTALVEQVCMWLNTNSVPIHVLVSRLILLYSTICDALSEQTDQQHVLQMLLPLEASKELVSWRIPESLLHRALMELKTTLHKSDWIQVLVDLLPLIEPGSQQENSDATHQDTDDASGLHCNAYTTIQRFTTHIPAEVVVDVLHLIPYLSSDVDKAEVLAGLIPRLPNHHFNEGFVLVSQLPTELQCQVWVQVASTLTEPCVQRVIAHLQTLPVSSEQQEAMMALAHQ